jgi:hypothetical protein
LQAFELCICKTAWPKSSGIVGINMHWFLYSHLLWPAVLDCYFKGKPQPC